MTSSVYILTIIIESITQLFSERVMRHKYSDAAFYSRRIMAHQSENGGISFYVQCNCDSNINDEVEIEFIARSLKGHYVKRSMVLILFM